MVSFTQQYKLTELFKQYDILSGCWNGLKLNLKMLKIAT